MRSRSLLKTYSGSCHCGVFWVAVAKPEGFRLLAGKGEMTEYRFNTKKNQHFFCKHCGVRAFGVGQATHHLRTV